MSTEERLARAEQDIQRLRRLVGGLGFLLAAVLAGTALPARSQNEATTAYLGAAAVAPGIKAKGTAKALKAPLTVIDNNGWVVLSVDEFLVGNHTESRLRLYNFGSLVFIAASDHTDGNAGGMAGACFQNGKIAAMMGAQETRGAFKTFTFFD